MNTCIKKRSSKIFKTPDLVDSENILMPPLHIKFGLAKQFGKAINKDEDFGVFLPCFVLCQNSKRGLEFLLGSKFDQCPR